MSFFFEDVEKKVRLKSPKLHTPRKVGTSSLTSEQGTLMNLLRGSRFRQSSN